MPIEVGIWRLGKELQRVEFNSLQSEAKLEDTLASDLSLVAPDLMLIGRQVSTAFGTFIDLLAIDREGNLVVIELKRDRTPREVVAQTLDYASWVENLSYDQIAEIYSEKHGGQKFEVGYSDVFGASPPEAINESHRMIVVASELDRSTERILNYLNSNYGVPINSVFFRYFKDGSNEYLTRTWLIDPQTAEEKTSKSAVKKREEIWNGRDFYISQGEFDDANWDDCRRYGFVCGSGGKWYTQTLDLLFPGARVFVNIPQRGYVGVGIVKDHKRPVSEFVVNVNGNEIPILNAPLAAKNMAKHQDDPEKWSYLVRVEWIKTVSREQAYWEKGLFAVQHTACRLRNQFTIEKLTKHFELKD
ncbi:MAG: endonuclease NucS [Planctomycetaceae bacterium]|nr:endonuclease NucS [Planctomycetaceae bacterium]